MIALDYGMRGGKAKIKVRRALLYYALKLLCSETVRARHRSLSTKTPRTANCLDHQDIVLGERYAGQVL